MNHKYQYLHILVFLNIPTFEPENTSLGIKVDGLYFNGQRRSYFVHTYTSSSRLSLHFPI